MPATRPATITELAAAAAETAAPPGRVLMHYIRVAESHRRTGAAYMGRASSNANSANGSSGGAGGGGAEAVGLDMERAFIEYARAATLLIETIPEHRDYQAGLSAEQKRTLKANGEDILENLIKLKAALVERFERYTRAGGSTADAVPLFKAAAAMAANAQQQHQQRAMPASVTSTASSVGRDSQATLVYQPNTSSMTTVLDSVEKEWIDSLKMPKNFITRAFSLLQQTPQGPIIEIRNMLQQWVRWDILESLASYHWVVKILFGVLKDTLHSTQLEASHVLAEEIFQCLSQDLYDLEDQLVVIFRDSESYKIFLACRGDLAQRLLDLLQDFLDSFPESSARPRLSKALERLSRVSGLQPTCFSLPGLVKVDQQVAAGGFGDIWKGLVGELSVSVKIMRLFRDADMKEAMQEFRHEALIWRQLSHPNLLPFFGLYYLENRLCLVSPWMSNGHIIEFLKNAPPDTDRVSLMLDVAMGVKYLHENHIVHGDLKGMNILVTPSCRACVADFGLASIVDAVTLRFTHSTASPKGGTARYQAPELLSTETPNHFGSDVYAFGSVCYEIFAGKAPFFEISRDITVTIKVLEGLRPSRPDTVPVDDDLWRLLQDCWQATPSDRPNISQIIQRLVGTIGAKSTDAVAVWDESISSKSRRSLQEWPLLPSIAAIERLILGKGIVKTHTKWFPEARRNPSAPTMPEIPLAKPGWRTVTQSTPQTPPRALPAQTRRPTDLAAILSADFTPRTSTINQLLRKDAEAAPAPAPPVPAPAPAVRKTIKYSPRNRISSPDTVLKPMSQAEMNIYRSYQGKGAAKLLKPERSPDPEPIPEQPPAKKFVGDVGVAVDHYNTRPNVGVAQRETSPIIGLESFNNWVKSVVISRFAHPALAASKVVGRATGRGPPPRGRVLDIGCGKGGDLSKWGKARAAEVLAVDIAAVSVDQAHSRWQTMRGNKFDATFAALDCYTEPLSKAFSPAKLAKPFDVVSMQYCMRYAFESIQKARCMLENVSKWLRPGGTFIGTIPNADQLLENLASVPPDAPDLTFGNEVYKIRFEDRTHTPLFGHKYWFYLQDTVEYVPEYVVKWDNFVQMAAEYGLHVVYKEEFHDVFSEHRDHAEFGPLMVKMKVVDANGESAMDEDQWEAANIYIAFAFEKR